MQTKELSSVRDKLRAAIYKEESGFITGRANAKWLESHGLTQELNFVLQLATTVYGESYSHSTSDLIKAFVLDKFYVPSCKTCGTISSLKWRGREWQTYCSMKCCQQDPAVKERVKNGLELVDWDRTLEARNKTMIEKYGVVAMSQLPENKRALAERSAALWKDQEKVETAKQVREQTMIEKYGVSFLSQDKDRQTSMVQKSNETKQTKSKEEKQRTADKYRASRLSSESFEKVSSYEWIFEHYCVKKLRIGQLAEAAGCSWDATIYALGRHGIAIDRERENENRSLKEIELFEFIKGIISEADHSYRIRRKEMDIVIRSLKLGIEFNGVYWHSEVKVGSDYHEKKLKHFNEHGYRLIQIWEDDWVNNKERVKTFLRNILTKSSERIGANKTKVVELTQTQFNQFMDETHMQGATLCKHRYGLEYNGVILAAIGFKQTPKNETDIDNCYDLHRFANKNVTGAFSKLLRHFERTFNPSAIRTFADLEIVDATNNVYLKNGFVEVGRVRPRYKYFNRHTGKREHCKKWRIPKLRAAGAVGNNEHEMALSIGLIRCYDSGKIKYQKLYD